MQSSHCIVLGISQSSAVEAHCFQAGGFVNLPACILISCDWRLWLQGINCERVPLHGLPKSLLQMPALKLLRIPKRSVGQHVVEQLELNTTVQVEECELPVPAEDMTDGFAE